MNYSIGDAVEITDFYLANYPAWKVAGQKAIIKEIKEIKVNPMNLSKDDRAMYAAKYGVKQMYILHEFHVEMNSHVYIVSDFGFTK